jgi:hypothetical protein
VNILGAIIVAAAIWYVVPGRRPGSSNGTRSATPIPPTQQTVPGVLREADLRYLAETFEHVNDRVIAQIRGWDGLSAALLGAIIAVYVLFLDKAETYWLALLALAIPAILLYVNTEDRIRYSPDSELFEEIYFKHRFQALEGLVADRTTCIHENRTVRRNKRRGFYRSLNWLICICLAAALCKGYNGHGEINAKLHQVAARLEAGSEKPAPVDAKLHF